MKKFAALISVIGLVIAGVCLVWLGVVTVAEFRCKPSLAVKGPASSALADSSMGRLSVSSEKAIWIGDQNYSTLPAAVSAIDKAKATLHLPAGNWVIDTDLSIPENITLRPEHGSILQIADNKTLTINGPMEAGLFQIFSCTGTGKVFFGGKLKEVYPHWWGAKGDGVADDTAAFQSMFNSGMDVNIPHSGAYYKLSSTITLPKIVNVVSNHATMKWGAAAHACFKFDYDYVAHGLYYQGNRKISGVAFVTTDKNTRLIWAPYGIKRLTFEDCSFVGVWDALDAATTAGVGFQIDGHYGTRQNWTSDGTCWVGCTFQNFDTLIYLNGAAQSSGRRTGIDAYVDMQLFQNCNFYHYRRGVVMEYCHGTTFLKCTFMPSAYGYLPVNRDDGGFRLDLTQCTGITVLGCYWENVGKDRDYAKIRLNSPIGGNSSRVNPLTIINCNGLYADQMNDATLPVKPVHDLQMPQAGSAPGIDNKLYRVNWIDQWGNILGNSLESPNIIAGSNRGLVLHNPTTQNVIGSAGLTTNWDPKTNKAVADTPMTTIEINNRKPAATENYISFRYQIPGSGGTPSWAHSGNDPTYGSEFARITYGGDIISKGKVILDTVQIQKGAGSPEGKAWGSPGDLYLSTDGGIGTTLYVKEIGRGTNTGWIAK